MTVEISQHDWDELVKKIDVNTAKLGTIEKLLVGNGRLGFLSRVAIMWQVWVWTVPVLSMVIGGLSVWMIVG